MMLIIVASTFTAVFLTVVSLYLVVGTLQNLPSTVLKKRLRQMTTYTSASAAQDEQADTSRDEIRSNKRWHTQLPFIGDPGERLEQIIYHAGLTISPRLFIMCTSLAITLGFCAGYVITKSVISAAAVAAAVACAGGIALTHLTKKRNETFTGQLPEVLAMISRSLRAGHSMTSAIELVSSEIADPAGGLFKIAFEQQRLGVGIIDTLDTLTEKMESLDLRFFVTSVSINSEVGGNLADVLENLADTIRQRLKIKRQVRVITSQGRLTGYLLGVLPIAVFLVMTVIMPGYEEQLFKEKQGQIMLIGAIVLQVIGFLVIRKIINIRI